MIKIVRPHEAGRYTHALAITAIRKHLLYSEVANPFNFSFTPGLLTYIQLNYLQRLKLHGIEEVTRLNGSLTRAVWMATRASTNTRGLH